MLSARWVPAPFFTAVLLVAMPLQAQQQEWSSLQQEQWNLLDSLRPSIRSAADSAELAAKEVWVSGLTGLSYETGHHLEVIVRSLLDDVATTRSLDDQLTERKWLSTAVDLLNSLRELEFELVLLDIALLDDKLWSEANAPLLSAWVRPVRNARRGVTTARMSYSGRLNSLLLSVDVIRASPTVGR